MNPQKRRPLTKEERAQVIEWLVESPAMTPREVNRRFEAAGADLYVTPYQLTAIRRQAGKRYQKAVDAYTEEATKQGLATRAARISAKMERHEALQKIVRERGLLLGEVAGAAGGSTGYIVQDWKGKDADIPVYKVDAALLKEFRDLEREIAIELSQWAERKEISGPEGAPIPVAVTDLVGKIYGTEDDVEGEGETTQDG